ncbi:hypothetical protein DEIGR_100392 [Deinococcus grandis]|uniref:Uncharacterized protein n=1 Tax=Deinococcus grandis TaxID=57498 RepID=A0A100HGQ8_9DEIO|nr:hypothetical protein [Deinococcus grandis]BBN96153.1 hypothetical protein DEGR_28860 [Deinococcus grandis]GAQ20365.1 hypothetical protein DEIGR_100392 [Deinococcus grandis]
MTALFWLMSLLAAALAFGSVLLLTRDLPRVSIPGIVGEVLTFALLGALLLLDAPLATLLPALIAGLIGTAFGLYRLLNR